MTLNFKNLDKVEAEELLRALLIVGSYLDAISDDLLELLKCIKIVEFSELEGLDQIEYLNLNR